MRTHTHSSLVALGALALALTTACSTGEEDTTAATNTTPL